MLQSLAVIGIAAAVIYVFIPHDESDAPPLKTVDYWVELTTVRRAAPYPVAAPVGLPDQDKWRATSVSYDGTKDNAWHLGFLDPQNQYVAVEQSTAPTEKFVTEVSRRRDEDREVAADRGRDLDVLGRAEVRRAGPPGPGLHDGGDGHGAVRAAGGDGGGAGVEEDRA